MSVRPLKFWLTFFKLLLFEQVRFNYNQTWIIGALWEPSRYDAFRGHMTRSDMNIFRISTDFRFFPDPRVFSAFSVFSLFVFVFFVCFFTQKRQTTNIYF